MRPIILAMPKGRILDDAAKIFARAGYDLSPVFADSRKLVFECGALRVLVLRNSDIPTYVALGAADVGVVGSDVLNEEGRELFEPLDLEIAKCRMIVAERADAPVDERSQTHLRIASKYPRTTRAYLPPQGHHRRGHQAVGRHRARPADRPVRPHRRHHAVGRDAAPEWPRRGRYRLRGLGTARGQPGATQARRRPDRCIDRCARTRVALRPM